MKTLQIFISLMLGLTSLLSAQSYLEKGKAHYEKDEYREALYAFNKVLKTDTTNAELHKMRGNCFLALHLLDSAEYDYNRSLRLSKDFPEVYYNLSNLYRERKDPVKAERYMAQFIKIRPDDADGLFVLSRLMSERNTDSSFYFLQKAYALDSANQAFYSTLAWEHFFKKDYSQALQMAQRSRTKFQLANDLLPLEAYACFALGRFADVLPLADSLLARQWDDISFHLLRTKAQMLLRTPPEKYRQEGFHFSLTEVSQNINELDSWTTDVSHPYAFQTLESKFKNEPASLSLPEFFMVYYGYTTDRRYQPYGNAGSLLLKTINQNTAPAEALKIYNDVVSVDPFNLDVYQAIASLALGMEKMDEFQNAVTRYVGLMESIIATGDGKSLNTAYVVISPSHEYDVLDYMGMRSSMQSLLHANGHSYDILTALDENSTEHKVYFNIDKSWTSLSSAFKGNAKPTKEKKKKRKK